MKLWLCLLLGWSAFARAQTAESFHFKRDGLAVSEWTIELDADGKGRYGEPLALTEDNREPMRWREIAVGKATLERIAAGKLGAETGACETKAKHIANTGEKQLSYRVGASMRFCTFNYSDDQGVMDAVAAYQAVAETVQAGARLERKRRFDRLGLDAEMNGLANELKAGNATELNNIAPTLKTIARDSEVMQRVRSLAQQWLDQMPESVSR